MPSRYHFVAADEKGKIVVTCTDPTDIAIDLTGATLNLRWRLRDGTIENRAMEIEEAADGTASYTFEEGELSAPTMEYEVTITKADGTIITSLETQILGVRARLA